MNIKHTKEIRKYIDGCKDGRSCGDLNILYKKDGYLFEIQLTLDGSLSKFFNICRLEGYEEELYSKIQSEFTTVGDESNREVFLAKTLDL